MSVFEDKKPHALYVPNNHKITIKALTKLELAIAAAPGFGNCPVRPVSYTHLTLPTICSV